MIFLCELQEIQNILLLENSVYIVAWKLFY